MRDQPTESVCANTCACIACKIRLCDFSRAAGGDRQPRRFSLQRGERLEEIRDNCMKFWVLVRGTGAICTSFSDGRRQILALAAPGEAICGLISTGDRPNWLEALEECDLCEIDLSREARELAGNPAFTRALLQMTHKRLEAASQHLATLGRLDSTERVILFLAQMATRNGHAPDPGRLTRLPMSREDIADYLGLNTETVSRILTRLKKSGLVKFLSPTEFVIPDIAAIERRLPVSIEVPQTEMFGHLVPKCPVGEESRA